MMALSGTQQHHWALFNLRVRACACVRAVYDIFDVNLSGTRRHAGGEGGRLCGQSLCL